ncbi:FKBP-type peptidyl-prolyl cis-trans isomerase [Sphingobacterium hungaricum]
MNYFIKFLSITSLIAVIFSSCNKSDDFDNEYYKEQQRLDSTLNAQKNVLKTYAEENFTTPILDTATGIWWELLEENENDTYTYNLAYAGFLYVVPPTVKVIFSGELLNGVQVEGGTEPVEKIVGGSQGLPLAWQYAFYPRTLSYDGISRTVGGFTPKGLKLGAKIQFVTSSVWAYDNVAKGNIPADSPLHYTIEVTEIK